MIIIPRVKKVSKGRSKKDTHLWRLNSIIKIRGPFLRRLNTAGFEIETYLRKLNIGRSEIVTLPRETRKGFFGDC